MNTRVGLTALVAAFAAAPMAAQQAPSAGALVSNAMFAQTGGKYVAPKCSADKDKHFKTSSAATYLSSAVSAGQGPKSEDILKNGRRVATESLTQEGQDKKASAWYVYGRIALFQGDVAAADSALRKAEALAPDCKEEINLMRRTAYVALAQEAANQADAKNIPGASDYFRQAASFYPVSAFAPYNLATLYSEAGQPDSAIKYYGLAVASTSPDTNEAKVRKLAQFNQGVVLLNAGKPNDAVAVLEQYLTRYPDDADAKRGLAQAYRATGQADKARALDAQTGVSTATGPSLNAGMDGALALYRDKKYAEAAAAFEQVLASEPNNVTALAAQANAYLALKDGPKLAKAADKLSALEPLNKDALMLAREGHRLSKEADKANALAERILSLPMSLNVTALTLGPTNAQLGATATGNEAMDAKTGKALQPKGQTVVFEFLDKSGTVVDTKEAVIPALAKDQTHEVSLEGTGEGIVGYRYKVKA